MRPSLRIYFDTIVDDDIIRWLDSFSSSRERNDTIRDIIRQHILYGTGLENEILNRLKSIESKVTKPASFSAQSNTCAENNFVMDLSDEKKSMFEQAFLDLGIGSEDE